MNSYVKRLSMFAFSLVLPIAMPLFAFATEIAVEESRVSVSTLGGPFSSDARLPKEIPAILRIPSGDKVPAVLVVHGSTGIDGRGAMQARVLNQMGIATLEIDMWSPRQVRGPTNRPKVSLDVLPDIYGALAFLNNHPRIQAGKVGIVGFSYGGVLSMWTAFGVTPKALASNPDLSFKAHVAFYPACDVWLKGGRAEKLAPLTNPTGAPVLVINGTSDDYDTEPEVCTRLPGEHPAVPFEVMMIQGATHAFDSDKDYPSWFDPTAKAGKGANMRVQANPSEGQRARDRAAEFFKRHLK